MSNVIHVSFSTPQERQGASTGLLLQGFATARRNQNDVFWLKENGELLNILECTGANVAPGHLAVHEATYAQSADKLAFFPQYYRFILSMALDLEDLGLEGSVGEQMCDWVVAQDLVGGETSDIQRLEANRLLARRGRLTQARAGFQRGDVEQRLLDFVSSPNRFALPNKKAAYELTHIAFYLSEYGRKDPNFGESAYKSLINVGNWAFLDGNADLLAEICIALRYAKYNPPVIWEEWIAKQMWQSSFARTQALAPNDGYHSVFMAGWLGSLRGSGGLESMNVPTGDGVLSANLTNQRTGVLRALSQHLFQRGAQRSDDWGRVRGEVDAILTPEAKAHLSQAEAASAAFPEFFESFARTAQVNSA